MKKSAIALMGIFLYGQVTATDWRLVQHDEESAFYIDIESITPVNNIDVSKTYLNIAIKMKTFNAGKSTMMIAYYASCDGYYFVHSMAFRNEKGDFTHSWKNPEIAIPLNFSYAFPETSAANIIKKACDYHKTKRYSY